MANIESKLTTIRTAAGGEDVRDAIIGALRDINNDVPADMSNPKQKEYNMPQGSDLTVPINPPELISQIIVRQPNSGGKSTTLQDITITENGEYPADDPSYDPNKENRYYDKVTVKVPQLANAVLDLEEEITQNGTYSAPADWGVDGLRTFTVNVNAATGDGPFKVEFYGPDKTSILNTQLIPLGGTAQFTALDGTTYQGQYFKGWNPSPVNVTRDMKCYPIYGDVIITPGSIEDDWSVIVMDGGAHYPIGSYKSLLLNAGIDIVTEMSAWECIQGGWTISGGHMNSIVMDMVKVAEGESGSKSTWISTGICTFYHNPDDWRSFDNSNILGPRIPAWNVDPGVQDWGSSWLRHYLNDDFINDMPDALKNNIKTVTKYYTGRSVTRVSKNNSYAKVEKSSLDKIWVPSIKELYTRISAIPTDIGTDVKPYSESNGIDYSLVYAPTWRTENANRLVALRSSIVASTSPASAIAGCGIAIPTTIETVDKDYQGIIVEWEGSSVHYAGFPIGFCL